jgi:hypothetical protein
MLGANLLRTTQQASFGESTVILGGSDIALNDPDLIWAYAFEGGIGSRYPQPASTGSIKNVKSIRFSSTKKAFVVGLNGSPWVVAMRWSGIDGFGTIYANPTTPVIPSGTTGVTYSVCFTADNSCVIIGTNIAPRLHAYTWSDDDGWGTKFSDPAVAVGTTLNQCALHPDDNVVFCGVVSAPRVMAYAFDKVTGFGTRYSNPSVILANSVVGIDVHPSGSAVAVRQSATTNGFFAYSWSTSGWGSAYTSAVGAGLGGYMRFSPNGNVVACGTAVSPFVEAYPFDLTSGYGTKYSNPTEVPTSTSGQYVAWTPDGSAIAALNTISGSGSAHVYAWDDVSGFGGRYAWSDGASAPRGMKAVDIK